MTDEQRDSNASAATYWYRAIAIIDGKQHGCPHRHSSEAKACAEQFCDTMERHTAESIDIQYGTVRYSIRLKRKAGD